MNLKATVDKLDRFVTGIGRTILPPKRDIDRLRSRGLTEQEAVRVWRQWIRGEGWTIDNIEDIEQHIGAILATRESGGQ